MNKYPDNGQDEIYANRSDEDLAYGHIQFACGACIMDD